MKYFLSINSVLKFTTLSFPVYLNIIANITNILDNTTSTNIITINLNKMSLHTRTGKISKRLENSATKALQHLYHQRLHDGLLSLNMDIIQEFKIDKLRDNGVTPQILKRICPGLLKRAEYDTINPFPRNTKTFGKICLHLYKHKILQKRTFSINQWNIICQAYPRTKVILHVLSI